MPNDRTEYRKKYYLKNRRRIRKNYRLFYKKHRVRLNEAKRQYRLKNKAHVRLLDKKNRERNWVKLRAAEKRWAAKNKERLIRYRKKYAKKNIGRRKEYLRNWYFNNRERLIEQRRPRQLEWRKNNRGRIRANEALYRKNNRYVSSVKNNRRRALLSKKRTDNIDYIFLEFVSHFQGGICFYCGKVDRLTLDHILPLVRGGAHTFGNVVLCCITCNTKKGKKTLREFVTYAGLTGYKLKTDEYRTKKKARKDKPFRTKN